MDKIVVSIGFLFSAIVGGAVSQLAFVPASNQEGKRAIADELIARRIIATEAIEVIDSTGKTRIGLKMLKSGPTIWINDSEGNGRVMLAYGDGEGAWISVYDRDNIAALRVAKDGAPSIYLSQDKVTRAVLGVAHTIDPKTGDKVETGASSLTLFGKDRKVLWQAPD